MAVEVVGMYLDGTLTGGIVGRSCSNAALSVLGKRCSGKR